jgi:hypothetical protein
LVVMTDIDYYVEWSDWLRYERPVLAYTYVPEKAAGQVPNGIFSIANNVMTTTIQGGGTYSHELWDYNVDAAWVPVPPRGLFGKVVDYLGWLVGLWEHSRIIIFSIDHFQVGDERRIVSLVPFCTVPMLLAPKLAGRLARADFRVVGKTREYNVMRVLTDYGSNISISRAGEKVSVTIPEPDFLGASIRYGLSSSKHISDVARYVNNISANTSAILAEYFGEVDSTDVKLTVHQAGKIAQHFQCIEGCKVEDGKEYARRYAPGPLTEEAVYPVESHNNEGVCLVKRIQLPQQEAKERIAMSNRPTGHIHHRFNEYARTFVQLLVPTANMGHPLTVSEVHEVQDRPMQRMRSDNATMAWEEPFMVKAFQKREAYGEPNDPRNISGCPTTHTLRLSGFTLAFKKECLMGVVPWYMPGRTPVEIARSLMEFAQDNTVIVEGDYSRFDGTITRWLRENVEFPCYLRWARGEHHQELSVLLRNELEPRAVTKLGTRYEPGCSRLSGSPLTTDGNTILNAFVAYCTMRELKYDAQTSFTCCGLFYGDDSIMSQMVVSPENDLGALVRVAGTLGLKLKAKKVVRGEPVTFLSRIFLDIWKSPSSICDPARALLKIHTTSNVAKN